MFKSLQIMCAKYYKLRCMFSKIAQVSLKLARLLDRLIASKFAVITTAESSGLSHTDNEYR